MVSVLPMRGKTKSPQDLAKECLAFQNLITELYNEFKKQENSFKNQKIVGEIAIEEMKEQFKKISNLQDDLKNAKKELSAFVAQSENDKNEIARLNDELDKMTSESNSLEESYKKRIEELEVENHNLNAKVDKYEEQLKAAKSIVSKITDQNEKEELAFLLVNLEKEWERLKVDSSKLQNFEKTMEEFNSLLPENARLKAEINQIDNARWRSLDRQAQLQKENTKLVTQNQKQADQIKKLEKDNSSVQDIKRHEQYHKEHSTNLERKLATASKIVTQTKTELKKSEAIVTQTKAELQQAEENANRLTGLVLKHKNETKKAQEQRDLYDEVKYIILKHFNEHYDKNVRMEKGSAINSIGLYVAISKAKKADKKTKKPENGYTKIFKSIVEDYEALMASASDNSIATFKKEEKLKDLDLSSATSEDVINYIISNETLKPAKGKIKALTIVACALGAVAAVSAGLTVVNVNQKNVAIDEKKVAVEEKKAAEEERNEAIEEKEEVVIQLTESQKITLINEQYAVVEKGEGIVSTNAETIKGAKNHEENFKQLVGAGQIVALSSSSNDAYTEAYNSVIESENTIEGYKTDLTNNFESYKVAVNEGDNEDMELYKNNMNTIISDMTTCSQTASDNFEIMQNESNYTLTEIILAYQEYVESLEVQTYEIADKNSSIYQTCVSSFGGNNGAISLITIKYIKEDGSAVIKFAQYDRYGNLKYSEKGIGCTIKEGLTDEDFIKEAVENAIKNKNYENVDVETDIESETETEM